MAVEKQTAQLVVEVDQKSASQAEKEIKRLSSPQGVKMAFDLGNLRQQLSVVQGQIRSAEKEGKFTAALQFRGQAETLKKQIGLANRELLNFTRTGNKEVSVLGSLFDNLGKRIGGGTGSIVSQLGSAANSVKSFAGAALTGAGILGLAAGLTALGKSAIVLGDRLEQAQISFEVMLGSAEKAKELLLDLSEFAKRTPFELLGIRDVAKQLLAFGITQENLLGTLKALGDVAAGTGTGLDRIAYAFGQVRAAGKLTGNELRQFTEAGVPLLAELAKMYGVTEGAARQMITDNLVGFNDVQQAFVNMTSEGGKFFNLMDRQSTTLSGKISNLKDSFNQLLEEGGGGLTPFAKTFIDTLRSILDYANVFFINLHGGFKLLQSGMVFIINEIVLQSQKLYASLRIAGNNVVGFFKDLYVNAGVAADNLGIAFRRIPGKIAEALNAGLQKLEDFLNKASKGISNFAKKFGLDIDIGSVSLGRLSAGGGNEQYKEFVKTNAMIADERNRAISEDIKAKETQARRVNELAALELDRVINEANEKLNVRRELNFELKKSDDKLTKDTKGGADQRAKIEKEEQQLKKDSLKSAQEAIKKEIEAQEDLQKEYEETIKTLKKGLDELAAVTKKLNDLNKDTAEKIADRFANIGEKISDIKDELQDFTAEEINFANQVKDSIGNLTNDASFTIAGGDLTVKEIKEIVKLQEELAALEKEQALAKANTTDEAIKGSQASETEKILAAAEEKKKELEQERLDIETRIGYKEEEARRELAILEQKKIDNAAAIEAYKSVVDTVEKEITAVTKVETDKRLALYAQEEDRLRKLIALRLQAGVSTGGPAPSTNTDNSQTNTTVIVNADVTNDVDMDKLGNTLVKKINNSNKGVN